jgi:hypothetical protein
MSTERRPEGESGVDEREASAWRAPFSLMFWLQVVLGVAVAGYGVYMLNGSGWKNPTGFLLLCVGVLLMPIWFARLIGGLALVGLAVWLALNALGQIDYLFAAVYTFVGGSAAMDGFRDLRARLRRRSRVP